MTNEQRQKMDEASINKALKIAYAWLVKTNNELSKEVDTNSVRIESIKNEKDSIWKVSFSYEANPREKEASEEKETTVLDAIYNKKQYQTFEVDSESGELISLTNLV